MSTTYYEQRAKEIVEAQKRATTPPTQQDEQAAVTITGKVIHLPPRPLDGAFKLEMNAGCELPVCVSNRKQANDIAIEIDTGEVQWRLVRAADSLLPSPEHYRPWLWFLDRLQAAAERGVTEAPVIVLDPAQLFDLFGGPRGGSWYRYFDDAFVRFSKLIIERTHAWRLPDGRMFQDHGVFGTLCAYRSLWEKPSRQMVFEFAKGGIKPGELLWSSVRSGYIKSIPLQPLRDLDYVGQRLYTYLSKHCQHGGEFAISAKKLLPKIPMTFVSKETKRRLTPHHNKLLDLGVLADVAFDGKGDELLVIYRRS